MRPDLIIVETCPDNPALNQPSLDVKFAGMGKLDSSLWETENKGKHKFTPEGVELVVAESGDSLNIVSKFYMLFGSFNFRVKSAKGVGVVTSIALISDTRDEIDWEALGREPEHIQSNYFGKGDDSDFTRGGTHSVPGSQERFVDYKIDWTKDYVSWSIDGTVVRTLKYADAKGGQHFPQSPMRIKIGLWAPGDPVLNRPGTVEWGGKIDWSKGPFIMTVESISLKNYSPGAAYVYTDRSGNYGSIKVIDGSVGSGSSDAGPAPSPVSTGKVAATPPPPAPTHSMDMDAMPTDEMPGMDGNMTMPTTTSTLPSSTLQLKTTAKPAVTTTPANTKTGGAVRAVAGGLMAPVVMAMGLAL